MNDENKRSVASDGSVAGGVVEHAKKCVDFWRSMMDGAGRIGMEAPSLAIGGVSDLVDGLLAEIARLRLTEAEREAIEWAVRAMRPECRAVLQGLLERLK